MDQVTQQTSGRHRFIECLGTEYAVLAENWENRYTPSVKFCGMRECFPSDITSKIQEKLNAKQLP